MNYLAHVFLSCGNEELLIGNFMADFCRNKDLENLPDPIMKGIELHRSIDSYTDNHPLFKQSTSKFFKRHGKYAPVLTDMIYDVLLIKNWERYSGEQLDLFVEGIYPILKKHVEYMPKKLQSKIDKMIGDNFLLRYANREGIQQSLEYMDRRTKFPSNFSEALKDLDENYDNLDKEFNAFFPDLIAHVDAICEC